MELSGKVVAEKEHQETLAKSVHLMAAWPFLLIFIGGVIGGILALIAYLINLQIYKSQLSKLNKILANLLCGMSAISLWWFIGTWVQNYL